MQGSLFPEDAPGPYRMASARRRVLQPAASVAAKEAGMQSAAAAKPDLLTIARQLAKGGDPAEWPADLRVREFPQTKVGA